MEIFGEDPSWEGNHPRPFSRLVVEPTHLIKQLVKTWILQIGWLIDLLVGGLEPTHLKNMRTVKIGSYSPDFRGENSKNI